jgi:hypothetical protein
MGEVGLAEGHKEADSPDARDVLREGLDFLVVQKVHVPFAHAVEIVRPLDLHGPRLDPASVFPIGTRRGYLPEIDLGVKVGGKGIPVVAAVAVQDVDFLDRVEMVLPGIGAEHARDAGVKAAAQEGGDAFFTEFLPIGPLPGVIKVRGKARLAAALFINRPPGRVVGVLRLVVRRVQIAHPAREAGVHDREILIRQGKMHHEIRLSRRMSAISSFVLSASTCAVVILVLLCPPVSFSARRIFERSCWLCRAPQIRRCFGSISERLRSHAAAADDKRFFHCLTSFTPEL